MRLLDSSLALFLYLLVYSSISNLSTTLIYLSACLPVCPSILSLYLSLSIFYFLRYLSHLLLSDILTFSLPSFLFPLLTYLMCIFCAFFAYYKNSKGMLKCLSFTFSQGKN